MISDNGSVKTKNATSFDIIAPINIKEIAVVQKCQWHGNFQLMIYYS